MPGVRVGGVGVAGREISHVATRRYTLHVLQQPHHVLSGCDVGSATPGNRRHGSCHPQAKASGTASRTFAGVSVQPDTATQGTPVEITG